MCPNLDVVMFQPHTGTSPDLGSVVAVNLITSLPHPTCFNRVLDLLPSPGTHSYAPPICRHSTPLHLSLLHPILPLTSPGPSSSVHPDVVPTRRLPLLVPFLTSLAILDLLPSPLLAPGVGGPAHFKLNFKKYILFVRLKFYHFKKHRTDRPWFGETSK